MNIKYDCLKLETIFNIFMDLFIGIEHFLYVENIEFIVYIFTFIGAFIFLYGLYRSYRRWFRNGEKPDFNNLGLRVKRLFEYSLFQRKVLYRKYEGVMHVFIFIGFIILFIGTLIRALESDVTLKIFGFRIITGTPYLIYKFILNIAGLLAIIGILMAFVRRLLFKSKNLPDTLGDYLILLGLLYILITGFILDGLSTLAYRYSWIDGWDPVGYLLASAFSGYKDVIGLYQLIWLTHMTLAIFMVAFLPYTKLYHIIVGGLFNIFFSRLEDPSAFKPIEKIDEIIESGGTIGAITLKDFTWKQRMDFDACVKCARCVDNCPANISGKDLNPMEIMLNMRGLMDRDKIDEEIVPGYMDSEIIWSCVTCGACVYQCPLLIHHVETILDLRRGLISKGENVPDELLEVSYNLMRYGRPSAYNPMEREEFIKELIDETGIEIASENKEYEYIYWIGCQTTYDPTDRSIAKSLLKILVDSGVNIAILPEENCCGEPARRIGDELMFKELVNMNKELLSRYRFRKLVVNCPHGYNVFKHEYPQYGFKVDVIHHSQLLYRLIKEGRIQIKRKDENTQITFHDPCYLGRWNGIYDEPRFIIKSSIRNLIEMPRSREKSFCCGGGGGQLFFEVKKGERISKIRMKEALETGAKTIGVACPFCKIMLNSEATEGVKVLDISEILYSALYGEEN